MDERGQRAAKVRAPPAPCRGVSVAPFYSSATVCLSGWRATLFHHGRNWSHNWRAGLPRQPACLPAPQPGVPALDRARPGQDAPRAKQHKGRDESPVLEVATNGILCMRFASGELKLVPRYVQDGRTVAVVDGQILEVAHVVAASFHGPPPQPDWIVQHINGDMLDDSADNLLWVPPPDGGRPQPDGRTGRPRCKVVCKESEL